MPIYEAQVDFSAEDILINVDLANRITLLHKSLYLEYWQGHFYDLQVRVLQVKLLYFLFILTRDAVMILIKLNKSNQLYNKGGLAYHKLYNLNKDMFACLIKKYSPFSNTYLEVFNLSNSHLKQWFTTNRRGETIDTNKKNSSISAIYIKAQLIKGYEALKTKIIESLITTIYK